MARANSRHTAAATQGEILTEPYVNLPGAIAISAQCSVAATWVQTQAAAQNVVTITSIQCIAIVTHKISRS